MCQVTISGSVGLYVFVRTKLTGTENMTERKCISRWKYYIELFIRWMLGVIKSGQFVIKKATSLDLVRQFME